MRLHPTIPFLFRMCTTKYTTPDGLTIDKGTKIVIPALTLQMNPSVYPEPELFKPERFSFEEKNTNLKWLPFGEGPRKCLGKLNRKISYISQIFALLFEVEFLNRIVFSKNKVKCIYESISHLSIGCL